MNTSVETCASDSTKFGILIPYLENSNLSVAGEDQEGVKRIKKED